AAARGRKAGVRPRLEELEARRTPAISSGVVDGILVVSGDASGNTITLDHQGTSTIVNGRSFADAAISGPIAINSGLGNDTVNILATAFEVSLDGQQGLDTVNLGDLNGRLQSINAFVNIRNKGGSTALKFDDSGDTTPQTVTLFGGDGFDTV